MFSPSNTGLFVRSTFLTTDTIHFLQYFYLVYFTGLCGFFLLFISLYYLNMLFTEMNSSWIMYESIKALKIKTSVVSNLILASNTILSFFFCFSIIHLYSLISEVISWIFNPSEKLAIPRGTSINETNAEIETQPLTVEKKQRNNESNLNYYTLLYAFQSLIHYVLFQSNLLLDLIFYLKSRLIYFFVIFALYIIFSFFLQPLGQRKLV